MYAVMRNNKKVTGYVFCKRTNRMIPDSVLYWFDKSGDIRELVVNNDSDGKFEVDLPEYVDKLYISSHGYMTREVKLRSSTDQILVHVNRS